MISYKQLEQLRNDIFSAANEFAGDETGAIAVELHQASNHITKALNMIQHGITQEDNDRQLKDWCAQEPFPISQELQETLRELMINSSALDKFP